jgi:hypothetical protein
VIQLQRNEIWRIVALVNKYRSIGKTSEFLGWSTPKLSKTLKNLIEKNIVVKHYVVPLEISKARPSIAIVYKSQKSGHECFKKPNRVIIGYYSYTGNPTYLYYIDDECPKIEKCLEYPACRIILCESIRKTLLPIEDPDLLKVDLAEINIEEPVELDGNTALILFEIFKLFNPSLELIHKTSEIIEYLKKKLGLKNPKSYFYTYVRKVIVEHYVPRFNGDYLLIYATSASKKELNQLMNQLIQAGFTVGYSQVHVISEVPVEAVIHAWGFYEKFLAEEAVHSHLKNVSYTVYPVLGVQYG